MGAESTPDPNTRPIHHLMPVTTRKLRFRYSGPDTELREKKIWLIFGFNIFELIKTDMKIILHIQYQNLKGLASYCKAETTFTFYFSILTLSNAFLGIDNREMKSESGFSFALASQPL